MNLLSQLLNPAHILLNLEAGSKKRVFEQAGLLFENENGIARATVFDSLLARERLASTGLGHGVAIPHGRIRGLKQTLGAFFRLAAPIPFEALDGRPVNTLFFMLVPENANEQHLQLLSELAQRFADPAVRQGLLDATDSQTVIDLFSRPL